MRRTPFGERTPIDVTEPDAGLVPVAAAGSQSSSGPSHPPQQSTALVPVASPGLQDWDLLMDPETVHDPVEFPTGDFNCQVWAGHNKGWVNYQENQMTHIRNAHNNGERFLTLNEVRADWHFEATTKEWEYQKEWHYVLDLENMTQRNVQTNKVRNIRYVPAPPPLPPLMDA
jgi:hypothetical protein